MNWKRLFVGILTALVVTSSVFAHALIDHADPKVGSKVKTSPEEIRIWFTERSNRPLAVYECWMPKKSGSTRVTLTWTQRIQPSSL